MHFVPIKYDLGDYFITEIKKQLYCFKIVGNRIKTCRTKFGKPFQILQYDTDNYMPIEAEKVRELEMTLRINNLPKMSPMLVAILKRVGKKEKQSPDKFKEYTLSQIIEEMAIHKEKYPEHVENITTFINELSTTEIITPVKKLTEFLDSDLLAGDPKFLGDVITSYQRTDFQQKKMANMPKDNKSNLLKILLIVGVIISLAIVGIWYANSGQLSGITSPFGSFSITGNNQGPLTAQQTYEKYPTPTAARAAIDCGQAKLTDFPKNVQDMIKTMKPVTACP